MKLFNYMLSLVLVALFSTAAMAQAPGAFSYQAVVRDAGGSPITTNVMLRLSILETTPTGPVVYEEVHSVSPNEFGIVALNVGEDDPLAFAAINWGAGEYFLKVEMDAGGGFAEMGTPAQILSAPYAIFSKWSETDNDWTIDGGMMYHMGNNVGIGTDFPTQTLDVETADLSAYSGVIRGQFTGTDSDDGVGVVGMSVPTDYYGIGGHFQGGWRGVQGVVNPTGSSYYYGVYGSVSGGDGTNYGVYGYAGGLGTNYAGYFAGPMTSTGKTNLGTNFDGSSNVNMGTSLSIYDASGYEKHFFSNTGSDGAWYEGYGANGSRNIWLTNLSGNGDHGYIGVCDAFGNLQAGMYVNSAGQGVLFKDVDNFRMDHPEDPDKEIWYAALEGPEAGAYERGVASLEEGAVFVPYSEHFGLVVNPTTVTVILTPHSADTYGLAVVEKTTTGFWVKELMNGTGNFSFDWEAKGVRQGFEEYEVVRDRMEFLPESVDRTSTKAQPIVPNDPKRQN
jgi:hypothetical protein